MKNPSLKVSNLILFLVFILVLLSTSVFGLDIQMGDTIVNQATTLTLVHTDTPFNGTINISSINGSLSNNLISFSQNDFINGTLTINTQFTITTENTFTINAIIYDLSVIDQDSVKGIGKSNAILIVNITPIKTNVSPIDIIINTNKRTICRYNNTNISNNFATVHSINLGLNQGVSYLDFTCIDLLNNLINVNHQIIYDSIAPIIQNLAYKNYDNYAKLEFDTDTYAECRAGLVNSVFESLTKMNYSNTSTDHYIYTLNENEGDYNIHIKCRDYLNNEAYQYYFAQVRYPLTASINTNPVSPFNAGIIDITLQLSKEISNLPILQYRFSGGGYVDIALSKEGPKTYRGYVSLGADNQVIIGNFHFSGTDNYGQASSTITSGSVFILDTELPPQVKNVQISKTTSRITLNWDYDGEELDKIIIYKLNDSDFDKYDELSSDDTDFTDKEIIPGEIYKYKIVTKDLAGNEGTPFETDQIIIDKLYSTSPTSSNNYQEPEVKLDDNTLDLINDTLKDMDQKIFDFEHALEEIKLKDDPLLKTAIEDMGTITKLQDGISEIKNIREQTKELYKSTLDTSEIEKTIQINILKVKKVLSTTATNIELSGSLELNLIPDDLTVETAVDFVEDNDKENVTKLAISIKEDITVKAKALLVKLSYYDKSEEFKTIITKEINTNQNKYESPNIVETIPKSLAQTIDNINFITKNFHILKSDPVVSFNPPILDYEKFEIKYILNGKLANEDLQTLTTVVVPKKTDVPIDTKSSKVTGFSIFPTESLPDYLKNISYAELSLMLLGLIVIAGLLGYYVIIVRYKTKIKTIPTNLNFDSFFDKHRTDKKNEIVFNGNLKKLVIDANGSIDELQYDKSKKLLEFIEHVYVHTNFDPYEKDLLLREMNRLQSKVALYQHIADAYHHAKDENVHSLKEVLAQIYDTYAHLNNKDTKLAEYSKKWYNYYHDQMEHLEHIKQFSNEIVLLKL